MAIRSGFFNSINGDRKYKAEDMAEYWGSLVGNGVHPEPETGLKVVPNDDMAITVKPGMAWINGYFMTNDDNYKIDIDVASGILNRTDRVVAKLDKSDREIRLEIKKGEESSEGIAPELQRDSDAYELGIAEIKIKAGAVSILQSDIKDTRRDKKVCGLVDSLIAGDVVNLSKDLTSHVQRKATNSGLGHVILSDVVQPSRKIDTGVGLLGGGNLEQNRNLSVDFGTGSTKVARGNHSHIRDIRYGEMSLSMSLDEKESKKIEKIIPQSMGYYNYLLVTDSDTTFSRGFTSNLDVTGFLLFDLKNNRVYSPYGFTDLEVNREYRIYESDGSSYRRTLYVRKKSSNSFYMVFDAYDRNGASSISMDLYWEVW